MMARADKRPREPGAGPVKRSVMIAGHATSISLEPAFWDALLRAAEAEHVPVSALVARIDAERVAHPNPANLASAVRVWLLLRSSQPFDRANLSDNHSQ